MKLRKTLLATFVLSAVTATSAVTMAATKTTKKSTVTAKKASNKTTTSTKKPATVATKVANSLTSPTTPAATTVASGVATSSAGDTTPKVLAATEAFLATLDASAKAKVLFADFAKQSDWSNLPDQLYKRDGLRMADMTPAQQSAAKKILETLLSPEGYQEIIAITDSDAALLAAGGMNLDFGGDRYHIRILGTPSATTKWVFQFGGHHLALNASIVGSRITLGPSLLAAQPSEFTKNGVQVRPMKDQTDLAYAAVNALSAAAKAKVATAGVGDLVLGAGADGKSVVAEGLALAELTTAEQSAVWAVVENWINVLNPEDAALKLSEVKATMAQTKFLWGGSTKLGEPAYYRIQGPKVYIEFSHQVGGGPNAGGWTHIHAIYRDPTNDYGAAFAA
jgi:Protein of unknown function (DUF3500)